MPSTGNHSCYCNKPENCEKYGRLYDWATAMALPSSCNNTDCSDQIQAKHRGICPSGWHIPSEAEWAVLMNSIDDDPGCIFNNCLGTMLKATRGWKSSLNQAGMDVFGFAALPSGYGTSDGRFDYVGETGDWWGASGGSERAYIVGVGTSEIAVGTSTYKIQLHSVRCVNDESADGTSSSSGGSSPSQNTQSSLYSDKGNDIKNYKTVKIGDQVWMAENLNYDVERSRCYGEDGKVLVGEEAVPKTTLSDAEIQANCDKYGRLYDWAAAMALPAICYCTSCASQIDAKHRGICPSGWHIPSDAEWTTLTDFVGGKSTAGTKLKATSGWNDYKGKSGNGTDEFGFAALPGGSSYSPNAFGGVGDYGSWWSAYESDAKKAGNPTLHQYEEYAYISSIYGKNNLFSVRCVQD